MKNAFVLGGTVPHAELVRKLKDMGFYTILVDYTDNPPASKEADLHLKASTLDKDEVLELAKKYNIDLIISTCIDQANGTACYVAEQLNLPIPYSYNTALNVTQKGRMKTIFKEYGIPTSDFYVVANSGPKRKELNFPLVVKPTDANSSKGVYRVDTLEDYFEKIEVALSISREGKAIVEQFVEGTEIQVDCIVVNNNAHVLMTRDKSTMQIVGKELQVAGFSIPGEICDKFEDELRNIAQKIALAFGLNNTPFFYQAICNEDGVYVLEFAPRIAGGTTYDMVETYTKFDYLQSAINSFLKKPIELIYEKKQEKYVAKFIYMRPGVFSEVRGVDTVKKLGLIDYYYPFIKKGKIVTESFNSGNRVAAIVAKDKSYILAENRVNKAIQMLKIYGDNNEELSFTEETYED